MIDCVWIAVLPGGLQVSVAPKEVPVELLLKSIPTGYINVVPTPTLRIVATVLTGPTVLYVDHANEAGVMSQ